MKRTDDFILKEVEGERVLVRNTSDENKNDENLPLTMTGQLLWNELKQETTRGQLMGAILAEYDVNEETAAVVVDTFIEKLEKLQAIKRNKKA